MVQSAMIVLFDLFGVVVQWSSKEVMPLWAEHAGVSVDEFAAKTAGDLDLCEAGKIPMSELWTHFGDLFNKEPSGFADVLDERFREVAHLNKDVVDIVNSFPKVFLLSNQLPFHAVQARRNGWFDLFDKVFLSFELGCRKPSAEIYGAVLKKLGASPEDVVFIDDKPENVEGARTVGMNAILFRDVSQLKADLAKIYKSD